MKIDTMRKVDYFAGIPLCFLVTFVVWILDLFHTGALQKPRKVLFVELSEMGSAILADPAMRKIQSQCQAELYFVIFQSNSASLRLLGTVPAANVFTIRADNLLYLAIDSVRFLFWTRRQHIDTVIDLELFSRYSALLAGLSGANKRVGFHAFHNEGLYRGAMLTHAVAYNPHQHIAKNFIALVNAAMATQSELPFNKTKVTDDEIQLALAHITPSELMDMKNRIRSLYANYDETKHRIVLINPNASDLLPQRRWMPDYFVSVMRNLLQSDANLLVLITGAPAERAQAERLQQQVGDPRCVNFAGMQTLTELPALYDLAELMLTNDSGPGHFSAITKLKTFVIFGPETPALYGSLGNSTPIYAGLACSPCVSAGNHRKTPCRDNVCLQVIKPEYVTEQLQNALKQHKAQVKPSKKSTTKFN